MTWNTITDTSSHGSFHAPFLAMAMTEQAHHCSSGLTKTFTCVQLSNTYLSATLTTAAFPTTAACRGFDASACTPTPRDLLSSHWQLRLHLIWKVANLLYKDVHLVAHGQVCVLRKSLDSPVAWEKWVGHWPVPCPDGGYWWLTLNSC